MDLHNGDCLEVMKELGTDSVDLLFADLPYAQTSCKWDVLIDMEKFWKEANRVCKDDAPMFFTCSVKFGNTLINSNPKKFRYDLVWVKSQPVGFLNAKKMPMKKHEMVYVFYNKIPKIYTENISLHHKHKFKDKGENKPKYTHKSKHGQYGEKTQHTSYASGVYEPPLPISVIKEEEKGESVYKDKCNSQLYGDLNRDMNRNKKEHQKIYDPPLPNSIIKEEEEKGCYMKKVPNSEAKYGQKCAVQYEPPLPNSILEVKTEKGKHATQKPVPLMEWVLKYYSKENDVVLDPTMGSGSTGVACKNMNRRFIGIEKDEEIYEVAFKRLND